MLGRKRPINFSTKEDFVAAQQFTFDDLKITVPKGSASDESQN